jgi:hypothetical protein
MKTRLQRRRRTEGSRGRGRRHRKVARGMKVAKQHINDVPIAKGIDQ